MAKKKSAPQRVTEDASDQAARLRRLQALLGHETDSGFATWLGISQQRWSNFLNGKPLSHEIAVALVQRVPGLTLDWLHFGEAGGLTLELARRLGELDPPGNASS